jgi:hypothetical protein
MLKNKYDFIADILENKRLTPVQRERLFLLSKEEIKKDGLFGKKLNERLQNLEDLFDLLKSKLEMKMIDDALMPHIDNASNSDLLIDNNSNEISNAKSVAIKKHSPKTMVKLLYLFSFDENFKWFTHKPDISIDKINFSQKLNEFDKNLKAVYLTWDLNFATYFFIINFFIDNSKKKSEYNKFKVDYPIQYATLLSYAKHEIREKIESGISPFDIVINNEHFSKTIQLFKNCIEFRLDIKEYKFESVFRNFVVNNLSIDFIEKYGDNFNGIVKSLTAYIDVNNFYRGLEVVFGWINDYKLLSKEVFIDLQNEDEYYNLIVFHKNSYFQTEPSSSKFNGKTGTFEILRKYWFSIVDWNIEADCVYDGEINAYNFICLNKNTELIDNRITTNTIEKLDSNVGGVKHTIKIYKTINL